MINEKELQAAIKCEGNCNTCDMDSASDIEFGCTKSLAKEMLGLLEENRKLKIICRDLDCCGSCKHLSNNGKGIICRKCLESGEHAKYWEFSVDMLNAVK